VDTSGSDYDTIISVWTGTQGNLSPVDCNDDIDPGVARQSRLNFGVKAGTTYRIMVSGYYAADSGTLVFHAAAMSLGFSRLARNGASGTGQSVSPGTRPSRPVRTGTEVSLVAGQSRAVDLALTSDVASGEMVSLECVGAPPSATCTVEPSQVRLESTSIPIQVRLQTTAGPASTANSRRSRRLNGGGTPAGDYELQVNARVGDVVRSTLVTATVESNPVAVRIKREKSNVQ
jgi:hypothetical protein